MKREKLRNRIRELGKDGVVLCFSGGVDSALLLKIASEEVEKDKLLALTFQTSLTPLSDLPIVKQMAESFGVKSKILYLDQFEDKEILNNPTNRCYLCKKFLYENAIEIKNNLGFKYVIDGSNFDDLKVYRPGRIALEELGIIRPLEEVKMTKKEVREFAKDLNIEVANRPSTPCMATRFPYGERLNKEVFTNLERGEKFLKSLGLENVRIRYYKDNIRIETDVDDFPIILEKRLLIIHELKALGFHYINLDLEGFRSGSMDEVIDV